MYPIYNFILTTSILLFISLYYHYNRFFIFFSLIVTFYRTHSILILHPGNKNYPHLYDFLTFWLLMPQMRWCCWLSDFVAKPLSVSYLISSKCLLFENIVMLGLFHFQSLSLSFRKYILKRWVLLHWLCSVTMIFHLSIIGTCYGATSVWYDKQITGWTNTPHHHQHNHLFSVVVVGPSI